MHYDIECCRLVTIDIDTKAKKPLAQAKKVFKQMGVEMDFVEKTKRGYHLTGSIHGTYWEVLVIRLLAGDDLKRLRLDAWPQKHAKNVFFTKKWKQTNTIHGEIE